MPHLAAFAIAFFVSMFLCATPSYAQNFAAPESPTLTLIMGTLGGITFLLYGLSKMSSSLRALVGDNIQSAIKRLTKDRFRALFTGALTAAAVQSSAATTVMTVGFVSAKLISLRRALAVILGADLGTILTIQLIAFQLHKYALIILFAGFFVRALGSERHEMTYRAGKLIMALGFIFFGLNLMSSHTELLKETGMLTELLAYTAIPALAFILGFGMTVLMQSSTAVLVLTMALATQQLLPLQGAFFVIIGANVGTCLSALIASLGKSSDAQRVAWGHTLFKLIGAGVFIIAYEALGRDLSLLNSFSGARSVAHIHTAFNVLLPLMFLPFIPQITKLLTKLIPERTRKSKGAVEAMFLDPILLETPTLAMNAAKLEVLRMSNIVEDMLQQAYPLIVHGTSRQLTTQSRQDDAIDTLFAHTITYLGKLSHQELNSSQSKEVKRLMQLTNTLEHMGDLLSNDIVKIGRRRLRKQVKISDETQSVLSSINAEMQEQFLISMRSFREDRPNWANKALARKAKLNKLVQEAHTHQAMRLVAPEKNRMNAYAVETDTIEKLDRLGYYSRQIASAVISE